MGLEGSMGKQRMAFQVEATLWAKAQRCENMVCFGHWERRSAWLEHTLPEGELWGTRLERSSRPRIQYHYYGYPHCLL